MSIARVTLSVWVAGGVLGVFADGVGKEKQQAESAFGFLERCWAICRRTRSLLHFIYLLTLTLKHLKLIMLSNWFVLHVNIMFFETSLFLHSITMIYR